MRYHGLAIVAAAVLIGGIGVAMWFDQVNTPAPVTREVRISMEACR